MQKLEKPKLLTEENTSQNAKAINHNRKLIIWLAVILIFGFLSISLSSFFLSIHSVREQISQNTLPLTAENVYAEIRKDLFEPVLIASMMANNSFLQEWIESGEKDSTKICSYLKMTAEKNHALTAFFVSERSSNYYFSEGILKKVHPDEPRDFWYYRVRSMESRYELNVDPDLANQDSMTLFINYKVFGKNKEFLGATGIGITISAFLQLIDTYHQKYQRNIYFSDTEGSLILEETGLDGVSKNISEFRELQDYKNQILSQPETKIRYSRNGETVHLNTRQIPELNWIMYVEENEAKSTEILYRALFVNLGLTAALSLLFFIIIQKRIHWYQRITEKQKSAILAQHQELIVKNKVLQLALDNVKKLHGLLPICASCKKIRNDEGYWEQIEVYIKDHSEADFSHGICPDCLEKLYPEYKFSDVQHTESEKEE
jgi:hypothetical protein